MQAAVSEVTKAVEDNKSAIERHEEQINGQRGLSAAIDGLAGEVKGLRKAAYWVAGLIIAGSITFAFSALTLIG